MVMVTVLLDSVADVIAVAPGLPLATTLLTVIALTVWLTWLDWLPACVLSPAYTANRLCVPIDRPE